MSRERVTQLLLASQAGDPAALGDVFELVYAELARLAHSFLRRERAGHTLNTCALVHEAFLKLVDHDRVQWQGRGHFFGVAALAMRRILVDHARRRGRARRGGGQVAVTLLDDMVAQPDHGAEIVAIDALLDKLAAFDPRAARVVECRFFGGFSVEETAAAAEISTATVKRSWAVARAWLQRELSAGTGS